MLSLKKHALEFEWAKKNMEGLLRREYGALSADADYRTELRSREARVHSQNGEDGLLLYILSQVGVTNRTLGEFGVSDGIQCNAANLIINFGWGGLLMDGSSDKVETARSHYAGFADAYPERLKIESAFVTVENVNGLFEAAGLSGEIDLLSIDIDGNDYWVWEALDVVSPRVVAIEYNGSFSAERAVTIPYDPDFNRLDAHESGWYHGASLSAFHKLGQKKGYRLVACDSFGVNAFFVRSGLPLGALRELDPADAYYPERKRSLGTSPEAQLQRVSSLPLTEV